MWSLQILVRRRLIEAVFGSLMLRSPQRRLACLGWSRCISSPSAQRTGVLRIGPKGVEDCPRNDLVKFSRTATAFPACGM